MAAIILSQQVCHFPHGGYRIQEQNLSFQLNNGQTCDCGKSVTLWKAYIYIYIPLRYSGSTNRPSDDDFQRT